jgi:hypothetical protein
MDNLLASIRPGIDDDEQSRQYFTALLRMHFCAFDVRRDYAALRDIQKPHNSLATWSRPLSMTRYTEIMALPMAHHTRSIVR